VKLRAATIRLFLWAIASLCAMAGATEAQERGAALDKILNPMPAYEPFDRASSPPEFFPDDIDKRARDALIDSLIGGGKALEDHLDFFRRKDRDLRDERNTITGLTDKVRDLHRERTAERDDDLTRAEALLRKSWANRFGAIFNRLLSSVDLVSIVSGAYWGGAVDAAMSQLSTVGKAEMSSEERRALVLYHNHLKRHPDHPKAEAIRRQVEALEKTKRSVLVYQRIEKAEKAREKGDLGRAAFYYEVAVLIDPESAAAKKGLAEMVEAERHLAAAREQALTVDGPRGDENGDGAHMRELLQALALRNPVQIEAKAKLLEENNPDPRLAAAARDAVAVAAEIGGRHDDAMRLLRGIAGSSSDPRERMRAEALLESSDYNLRASVERARSRHRLETVKYVLLGEDLLKRNLIYGTGPLVFAGPAGATSLAAANVLMIGTNLFEVLTANPISPQPVIDEAAAFIRKHPDSENAADVYTILAEAYEKTGRFDQALLYYELSGKAGAANLADLKERAARAWLQAAEKSGSRDPREMYLRTVIERYPDTEAAKRATRRLSDLVKPENQGLRLSKQFLLEHPDLYGPEGLRLKPTLFDGQSSNMELADRGISLLGSREIMLHFQTPWGPQSQAYTVAKEDTDRFLIALRQKRYDNPEKLKDLPVALFADNPLEREANAESGATILDFLREADGAPRRFPRVLDHQLLSENEKRSGGPFTLPEIQGSIGASRFDLSGSLPAGWWADRLAIGADARSPFAGLQLPIPVLQGFIPIDFMLRAGPGRVSVFPKLHQSKDKGDDQALYR
jgi:tetratricopeptide (TPR) repeat protein